LPRRDIILSKSTSFPYVNIHKYTWTSDMKTFSEIDKRRHSRLVDVRSFGRTDCDADHYEVFAVVRDRLSVSEQAAQKFLMEKFNL
jgi:hypothetical protein